MINELKKFQTNFPIYIFIYAKISVAYANDTDFTDSPSHHLGLEAI